MSNFGSDTDDAIDGVITKRVCLVNDVTYIDGVVSIKEFLSNLSKSYDWGTNSSKPLPSKMVSISDCVDSSSSNNNNTKSVDGDFTQSVNESFQEENGLKTQLVVWL